MGPLLRGWREQRRVSQLELALRADSSARHISFIETGRSRPSEEMVLRLAQHLDVPVRKRNSLLLAAGYAPKYTETPLADPAMAGLREGIDRLLPGYEPYPGIRRRRRLRRGGGEPRHRHAVGGGRGPSVDTAAQRHAHHAPPRGPGPAHPESA